MCLCLDARQKRHLSTIFWRLKTVFMRNRGMKIIAFGYPIMLIVIQIVLYTAFGVFKPTET